MENSIYLPSRLIDEVESLGERIDKMEATYLFWWLIDSWENNTTTRTGKEWKQVLDKNFEFITKSRETRAKIRAWLEENGFIEIRKTMCKDGTLRNLRIKNQTAQQYRTLGREEMVEYVLCSKTIQDCFSIAETANDEASQQTRKNLGLLRKKENAWGKIKNTEDRYRNRDQKALLTIENNVGSIKRGRKVDRLFSPWVTSRNAVRKLFTFGSDEIRSFDLQAAQPTLMGSLAKDEKLLGACLSDELYQGIARAFDLDRDKAKKAFYSYSYGPIRKHGTRRPQALLVQQYIADNYPVTANYVASQKQFDYRQFAVKKQNLEASIFVDGIFAELSRVGIPALTVHDSIYVGTTHQEQTKEITEEHLNKQIFGGLFKINQG
ncbi:MAG: hypothetical protein NTW52_18605 [Planctomycetota bacterium]|nr:hypothetical protein [Planctomycetota bacterium]